MLAVEVALIAAGVLFIKHMSDPSMGKAPKSEAFPPGVPLELTQQIAVCRVDGPLVFAGGVRRSHSAASTGQNPTRFGRYHQAKALVLSGIDFRVMDAERDFLAQQRLAHQYDWTTLARASLALAKYPHTSNAEVVWGQFDLSK